MATVSRELEPSADTRDDWRVTRTAHALDGKTVVMETRIRTHTFPSAPSTPKRERAYRIAERFMLERGRLPTPADPGAAGEAARLLIDGNLRAQVHAPAQPFERDGGRWRRSTAALALGRLDRAVRRPNGCGRREARPGARVRRDTSAGRSPPSDDPDDEPPPLARREGGRLGVRAYRDGSE